MNYKIICPYCFEEMEDDQVCFRSERVETGMNDLIPDDYDDLADFQARYRGADKDKILEKAREWEFFAEADDPVYTEWWSNFNGTTENNPADEVIGIKSYHRRVIDPNNEYHRKYLRKQADGRWVILDHEGMASQIELTSGERCNRRVCRHCHNPLPDNYGKSPVKFAAIIGITGAGKTVYLSQLLRNMKTYCAKAGLTAIVKNNSTVTFLENNRIAAGQPLPGSTPAERLQQPLFYELVHGQSDGSKVTETFVLYDVAGEVFKESNLVVKYAPFIRHADGLVLLIDPMQFDAVSKGVVDGKTLDDPTKALDAIHSIIEGSTNTKCAIPCAVCLSKVDTEAVQSVLSPSLAGRLLEDVAGLRGPNRLYLPVFNARQYNPIVRELDDWILDVASELALQMASNYSNFSYFAFTALGCNVVTGQVNGMECQYPEGPIVPRRVEEPILWLFNRLGYIKANERLYVPGKEIVPCPACGSENTEELPEGSFVTEGHFFTKRKIEVNRQCLECGHKWMHVPEYQSLF